MAEPFADNLRMYASTKGKRCVSVPSQEVLLKVLLLSFF